MEQFRQFWRAVWAASWPWFHRPWVYLHQANGVVSVWAQARRIKVLADQPSRSGFHSLELPEDWALLRGLRLPRLSPAALADAVNLDLQSVSPFAADAWVSGYRVASQDVSGMSVDTVIASNEHVKTYVSSIGANFTHPPEVWVLTPSGPVVLGGFGEQRRARRDSLWRYVLLTLAAGIILLIGAIVVTPTAQLRLVAKEAIAESAHEAASTQALVQQKATLQKAHERVDVLSKHVADGVDALWVLDNLTRLLPDDTALLSLQVTGGKVTMTGQTANAATLMQNLSRQEGVKDVKAPSPSTRPLGASKDQFVIEFQLEAPVVDPEEVRKVPQKTASAASTPTEQASAPPTSTISTPTPAPAVVAPAPTGVPTERHVPAVQNPGGSKSPFAIGGTK